jgi:hypothetical protein
MTRCRALVTDCPCQDPRAFLARSDSFASPIPSRPLKLHVEFLQHAFSLSFNFVLGSLNRVGFIANLPADGRSYGQGRGVLRNACGPNSLTESKLLKRTSSWCISRGREICARLACAEDSQARGVAPNVPALVFPVENTVEHAQVSG